MKEIKDIVEKLEIPKKKEILLKNRDIALMCKKRMSDLCLNNTVAKYAYNIDKIKSEENIDKVFELLKENEKLEYEYPVYQYKELLGLINLIQEQNSDYYKTIQTDFRDELSKIFSSKIYVYQGIVYNEFDYYVDIVGKTTYMSLGGYPNHAIFPLYGLDSKRKYRHFYNNVSFKYLEGVSEDYDFDLDNKRIGKVLVFKKTNRY